ncbi:MAG: hypothetical protein A2481_01855 [Candidatus Yonathbacteria bacterium RIFOXYC2_FULL_47_9]|nr:MAG: hypothetical protein A2481_01855 [Candidatus Yonathbacteria bacterium RIFOXYC2_FULL_47_9]HAT68500.1 hypothetical protein [Candidatus Yonathbacteria bacterium]
MCRILPSILFKKFDEKVLAGIVGIYADAAGIKDPCATTIDPRHDMSDILQELSDLHNCCEFRFGSSITVHSKLFLHPVVKRDGLHVAFDFDPNTADDAQPRAVAMREDFHKKTWKYLATLITN